MEPREDNNKIVFFLIVITLYLESYLSLPFPKHDQSETMCVKFWVAAV